MSVGAAVIQQWCGRTFFPKLGAVFLRVLSAMKITSLSGVLAITLAVSGCASSLVYDSGRNWKQRECYKIADSAEQQRCLDSTAQTYYEYRHTLAQEQGK